eukprot:COSAG02_NODE_152_length_33208_cov_13.316591_9_plen_64_part_00
MRRVGVGGLQQRQRLATGRRTLPALSALSTLRYATRTTHTYGYGLYDTLNNNAARLTGTHTCR